MMDLPLVDLSLRWAISLYSSDLKHALQLSVSSNSMMTILSGFQSPERDVIRPPLARYFPPCFSMTSGTLSTYSV